MRGARWVLLVWAVLLATLHPAHAEQPPARLYTTIDGLPRDIIYRVHQDSRGFLWIFTNDGVSRFDGSRFVTYTTDDGLPDRRVSDVVESAAGTLWFATAAGIARLNPAGIPASASAPNPSGGSEAARPPVFIALRPGRAEPPLTINAILADGRTIWCGTNRGLYRLEDTGPEPMLRSVEVGAFENSPDPPMISSLVQDRHGAIWMGTGDGHVLRRFADGRVEHYGSPQGLPLKTITALGEDREGNIWAGMRVGGGIARLTPDRARGVVVRTYTHADGLLSDWVTSIYLTSEGQLLAATTAGLAILSATDAEPAFRPYLNRRDLCDGEAWDVTEDRHGSLWIATTCGLMKIFRNGFTTYSLADGLRHPGVNSIFETADGALVVISPPTAAEGRAINRLNGGRFESVLPRVRSSDGYFGWGWSQVVMQDRGGSWWVPAGGDGLFRFPAVARLAALASTAPVTVYSMPRGSIPAEPFRVYEDRAGRVWVALDGGHAGLLRLDPGAEGFRDVSAETGAAATTVFSAFAEDAAGQLWIGAAEGGGLLRYAHGRFTRFGSADGAPSGWILWLHADAAGRLWLASSLDGLIRVDNPAAVRPGFVRYTTATGLVSNNVRCLAEDRAGRIYAGTGRGLDRLEPATGRVRHYTAADGLPKGTIEAAYRDRHGDLWFGSTFGLSRFSPPPDEAASAPAVFITGVTVAGRPRFVSVLGDVAPGPLQFGWRDNNISIDYVGLDVEVGAEVRYQYKLEPASEWSVPGDQRTINYPNLSSGTYVFMVRAVNANGDASAHPARVAFSLAPPVWRRSWFIAVAGLGLALASLASHRYRVRRLLQVADVRTRIATDLHDDIGGNLTRIAVLSEVARQRDADGRTLDRLASIAAISRESVSAMNDIVWAINPERDSFIDVVRRMRQHAIEVFGADGDGLQFTTADLDSGVRLDAGVRRDLFLIFKEAVNNAVRHSGCTTLHVECRCQGPYVFLRVADNGRGFDAGLESDGNGLRSMRARARRLGASLDVMTGAGLGTEIRLTLSLKRPRTLPWRRSRPTPTGR